jgi:serine/threonine-protein kinase 24/25/MST4
VSRRVHLDVFSHQIAVHRASAGEHNRFSGYVADANSFSTVRPMKKVDAVGSQQLSNEYIGSGSVRRIPQVATAASVLGPADSTATSVSARTLVDSPPKPRAALAAGGRAGRVLVDEVLLGLLDEVRQHPRQRRGL